MIHENKKQKFQRTRLNSDDTVSTAETCTNYANDDSFSITPRKMEANEVKDSTLLYPQEDNLLTISQIESPYMSALDLPTILEEDVESENGKFLRLQKKLSLKSIDNDDSPF